MRVGKGVLRVIGCGTAFLCLLTFSFAQKWVPDEASIAGASKQVRQLVQAALSESQADIEKDHVNVAFGFCTSFFGNDPAPAATSRAIASRIVHDHLVDGDKVYGFAWELGVWDHRPGSPTSIIVRRTNERTIKDCDSLWPLTTDRMSKGGHDTEQAIVDIGGRIEDGNTIVILFANSAATVAPKGIGENSDAYLAVTDRWERLKSQNKSGASFAVKYVAKSDGQASQDRVLDLVILVPKQWSSTQLPSPRSNQLAVPLGSVVPEKEVLPSETTGFPWLAIFVPLALIGLAAIVVWLLKPKGPIFFRIGDRSFNLDDTVAGEAICRIVGKDFSSPRPEDVILGRGPAVVIAEAFARSDKSVDVESKGRIDSVNGDQKNIEAGRYPLKPRGQYELTFSGTVKRDGLPPVDYSVDVAIEFFREGKGNG